MKFCRYLLAAALCLLCFGAESYRQPPQVVAELFATPRLVTPGGPLNVPPNLSPDRQSLVIYENLPLTTLAEMAEPVEHLAGLDVKTGRDRSGRSGYTGLSIARIANGKTIPIRLPERSRAGAPLWSPDGQRLAFLCYRPAATELWIADADTGDARPATTERVNATLATDFAWTPDGGSLVALFVPAGRGASPAPPAVPPAPKVLVSSGRPEPQRNWRYLLSGPHEAALFVHYTKAQLARLDVASKKLTPIGRAGMILDFSLGPDGRQLLVTRIVEPLSYTVPYQSFAREIEVWDMDGTVLGKAGHAPVASSSLMFETRRGPRDPAWMPDSSGVLYLERDEKAAAALGRNQVTPDHIKLLRAPYTGTAEVLFTAPKHVTQVQFLPRSRDLLVHETDGRARRARLYLVNLVNGKKPPLVLSDRSTEEVYNQPGRPLTLRTPAGHRELVASDDGRWIYFEGPGHSAEGQRPFLDRVDVRTGARERLFRSELSPLEEVAAVLDTEGRRLLTLRQTAKEPPNYYYRETSGAAPRALTRYRDPAPALTAAERRVINFRRPDGVELTGKLTLPAGYKSGTRLPTILWVYPNDFRSAAAAQQNTYNENQFVVPRGLSPEILVTQGYALLAPNLPVVGTNDKYVSEVVMGAKAAVDKLVEMGVTDPRRVGVGGHSYGAFTTGNLLAHSRLFRAGVAGDGAYNRTLTPFNFQREDRVFWEAREAYLQMSPFLYADRIEAPLLLYHGMSDTNVGTNPIQSERMYQALSGLGKTVQLVMYPFEDHSPAAQESVFDLWTRIIEWFDQYVKNAA